MVRNMWKPVMLFAVKGVALGLNSQALQNIGRVHTTSLCPPQRAASTSRGMVNRTEGPGRELSVGNSRNHVKVALFLRPGRGGE